MPMRPMPPGGQAAAEARPLPAAVGRLPDAAARAADVEVPRLARQFVRDRVEHVRVLAAHHEIDDARLVVDEERLLPRLAAVLGHEQAALGVGREEVAHRGDVDDVRVLRMDEDARDVVRVAQAHVRPRLARVGRLVDAVAGVRAARLVGLAGADPDRRSRRTAPRRSRRSTATAGRRRPARTSCRCSSVFQTPPFRVPT